MEDFKQEMIDNLIFRLQAQEIITQSDNSINFTSSTENKLNEGEILIDDSKKGIYKIYFVEKLRLILSAKDDFKFTNFNETITSTIAIDGIDSSSILDCIKLLSIK
jgi:hypothetical protein